MTKPSDIKYRICNFKALIFGPLALPLKVRSKFYLKNFGFWWTLTSLFGKTFCGTYLFDGILHICFFVCVRVHPDFRLILVAEDEDVKKRFPIPLINRLEKHYLGTL